MSNKNFMMYLEGFKRYSALQEQIAALETECDGLKDRINRGTCENCKHCFPISGMRMGECKQDSDYAKCCGFDFDCAHWEAKKGGRIMHKAIYAYSSKMVFKFNTQIQSNVENFMLAIGENDYWLSFDAPKDKPYSVVNMDSGHVDKFEIHLGVIKEEHEPHCATHKFSGRENKCNCKLALKEDGR